jgi:hypothetical protein
MAFQGSLKELPLPDIIQLVAVSGKTGRFQLRNKLESGQIFLRRGQIVHAAVGDLEGEEAVYELAIWPEGEFFFEAGEETATTTIQKSNTNLLMEAARRIDEWQVLSKKIPSIRLVPVFAAGSATAVSFTAPEWSVVRKIDERRSIEEIAQVLETSPFEVAKVLYGLLVAELVVLEEDLGRLPVDRLRQQTPEELRAIAQGIDRVARELLAGRPQQGDLEVKLRRCEAAIRSGPALDAVLDLIREDEKLVSAALGPHQARSFVDRIERLLGA